MKHLSIVLKIIRYAMEEDTAKVKTYARFLAQKLDDEGEHARAVYVRRAITGEGRKIKLLKGEG